MHGESDFIEENFKHVIDIKYICSKKLRKECILLGMSVC